VSPELESLLHGLPGAQIQQASPLGLVLNPDLDAGSWSALVASVAQLAGRVSRHRETATAWLGDLLAFGHGKYRGQITAYAEAAGLDPGTLRVAKLVCSRIPVLSRHNALSWSHHCEVGRACKEPRDIQHWLNLAATERLSVRGLRKRIRQHLAAAQPTEATDSADGANVRLKLLRGLRAMGRLVEKHPDTCAEWSGETCELALAELQPLIAFIEAVRTRTRGPRSRSGAS
jgi:hypothetical protein